MNPPTAVSHEPRRQFLFLLAAVTAGFLTSGYIAIEYIAIAGNVDYASACDINTLFACTPVYISRYGSVFGSSAAAILVWLYIAMGAVLLLRRRPILDAPAATGVYALSSAALGVSAYQSVGSAAALKLVCTPCLAIMGFSAIVFAMSGSISTMSASEAGRAVFRAVFSRAGLLTIAAATAAVTVTLWWFPVHRWSAGDGWPMPLQSDVVTSRQALARWYLSRPRLTHGKLVAADAIVLAKFNDYQCPPCAAAFFEYRDVITNLQSKLGDRFRVVSLDYPLDGKCNPAVSITRHPVACDAAVAARLAQGKRLAELEGWLYANQKALTQESLWEKLAALEISGDWKSRYPAMIELVRGDITLAKQLGVRVTPTFFLDGISLGPGVSPNDLATLADIASSRLTR